MKTLVFRDSRRWNNTNHFCAGLAGYGSDSESDDNAEETGNEDKNRRSRSYELDDGDDDDDRDHHSRKSRSQKHRDDYASDSSEEHSKSHRSGKRRKKDKRRRSRSRSESDRSSSSNERKKSRRSKHSRRERSRSSSPKRRSPSPKRRSKRSRRSRSRSRSPKKRKSSRKSRSRSRSSSESDSKSGSRHRKSKGDEKRKKRSSSRRSPASPGGKRDRRSRSRSRWMLFSFLTCHFSATLLSTDCTERSPQQGYEPLVVELDIQASRIGSKHEKCCLELSLHQMANMVALISNLQPGREIQTGQPCRRPGAKKWRDGATFMVVMWSRTSGRCHVHDVTWSHMEYPWHQLLDSYFRAKVLHWSSCLGFPFFCDHVLILIAFERLVPTFSHFFFRQVVITKTRQTLTKTLQCREPGSQWSSDPRPLAPYQILGRSGTRAKENSKVDSNLFCCHTNLPFPRFPTLSFFFFAFFTVSVAFRTFRNIYFSGLHNQCSTVSYGLLGRATPVVCGGNNKVLF